MVSCSSQCFGSPYMLRYPYFLFLKSISSLTFYSLVELRLNLMAIVIESRSQGNPSNGNLGPFPSMEVLVPLIWLHCHFLHLPYVKLQVWLFSTSLVMNVQTCSQLIPPPEQHQLLVDPQVDPFPSSPIVSSFLSSYSPCESVYASN